MPGSRLLQCCAVFLLLLGPALGGAPGVAASEPPAQIKVGYFKQWPAPLQFAQAQQTLARVLGLEVSWVAFRSGQLMAAALAAGELQIAYSLGHVPFLVGVNDGLDLTMVGVAVSYPENDNCIVRDGVAIDRYNASDLEGQAVAVRPGSVSHFRLTRVLAQLGIDSARVRILAVRDGSEAVRALEQGEAVMACAHGSSLRRLVALGKPLMSGAEQEALGLRLFDVIAVATPFSERHPEIVKTFLAITDAANRQWQVNPDPMRRQIAGIAEMDRASADRALSEFHFPSAAEQKTAAWMGGGVSAYSAELANFFVTRGQLEQSLDAYDRFVSSRFLP